MSKVVVFELRDGDFERGFAVTMQIGTEGKPAAVELPGKLPPNADILLHYQQWHTAYAAVGSRYRLSVKDDDMPNRGAFLKDCKGAATQLQRSLEDWLSADTLRQIRERFVAKVRESEDVRILVQTDDPDLQRLPWHLWSLFTPYARAEVAVISPMMDPPDEAIKKPTAKPRPRILAIFGDSTGIDTQADAALLKRLLPKAEICPLVEPTPQALTEKLWDKRGWDILFFAGHSSSLSMEGDGAWIQINPNDQLTLGDLKRSLSKAIANGLKLAMFNSCDGLGLAKTLADLQIPQVIVMREEVPDQVAKDFLRYFLEAFVHGEPLYYAVKEARSKLEGLEHDYPCASWLPVVYQNSPNAPLTWKEIERRRDRPLKLTTALAASLLVGGLVVGTRLLGLWQGLELQAYDHLVRSRPTDNLDPNIFVVRITLDDQDSENKTAMKNATWFALLKQLKQAKMVGLDILRNGLVGKEGQEWENFLLKTPELNMYGICERPNKQNPKGEKLSPGLDKNDKYGFSNVEKDWQFDRVLRRQILSYSLDPSVTKNLGQYLKACPTEYALSFAMAADYLKAEPQAVGKEWRVGSLRLKAMESRHGAYQTIDPSGHQILLNYRYPLEVGQSQSVQDVLTKYKPEDFKDKIVLIGADNPREDQWSTPYQKEIAGVFVHAQMFSYLLDVIQGKRPQFWVWSPAIESLWIVGWAIAGGLLIWSVRSPLVLIGTSSILVVVLYGGCFWLLQHQGGWIPLLTPAIAFVITTGGLAVYTAIQTKPASMSS